MEYLVLPTEKKEEMSCPRLGCTPGSGGRQPEF